jgi:hypothetical protein
MLMRGHRRQCAGRPGGKARGGDRALEAREHGMEKEDGEEDNARRMGRRSPRRRGRSGRKPPAFRGLTAADRQRGGG